MPQNYFNSLQNFRLYLIGTRKRICREPFYEKTVVQAMSSYLLNLLDLAFTLFAMGKGVAELNPLMGWLPVMILYKVGIVGLLCLFLSRQNVSITRRGLIGLSVVYAIVDLWHLINVVKIIW